MKRILILTILLVGVGIFTYQFEELGGEKRRVEEELQHKIIDETSLGEMKGIRGPEFKLVKIKENFQTAEGELVDQHRLQEFLDVLGKMKVRRYLDKSEYSPASRSLYFPEEESTLKFQFKNGEVVFLLGKKLDFDQSFYMEVVQDGIARQMIAFDSSANQGTYDKATFHKNAEKYMRFKSMILLTKEFFIDTHLFQKEYLNRKAPWQSIAVDNLRNRSFTLDIPRRTTTPAPPIGMGTKKDSFNKYIDELVSFSGLKWLKAGKLEDQVASVVIKKIDGTISTIKVYKKYNSKAGNFAHHEEENKILSFNSKAMELFYRNAQDFWDLRALPTNTPKKMQLAFPEQKNVDVNFKYGKVFEAFSLQKIAGEAINTAFKSLVDIFAREADHLTSFESDDEHSESIFKVSWPGEMGLEAREFHVILNEGELILANKKLGYKLHYRIDDLSEFGTKLKDFFLKQ